MSRIQQPKFGQKITIQNQKLKIPNCPIIPFIEGDGIGPDIWKASRFVFDHALQKTYGEERKIAWMEVFAGEKAKTVYDKDCPPNFLPEETIETIQNYLVAIKGPLTTPVGEGFRSLNVTLRQRLDLYTCLRPVRYFAGVPSPVKHPEHIDMVIFRENTEDIYAGIEWPEGSSEAEKIIRFLQNEMKVQNIRFPKTSGIGIKPVSREGTERLVKAAITYAIKNNRKSLTLVHKGNIMKYTEGAFKNWGYATAKKFFPKETVSWEDCDGKAPQGKILIQDVIADAFLQQILLRPENFDVIATLNLNGDYISDALAAQVGGIGIAPGGNINYDTGVAIFEATHGTAPKYAGLDKVNPSSVILSGCLMFEYLGWQEVSDLIVKALEKTVQNKTVTYDFARLIPGAKKMKCSEFAKEIVRNL